MGRDARRLKPVAPTTTLAMTVDPAEYWKFRTLASEADRATAAVQSAQMQAQALAGARDQLLYHLAEKYHVTPTQAVNFNDETFTLTFVQQGPIVVPRPPETVKTD